MDRFFRDKNLEELTRKTYDNMGLEVRDVLAKSDLYEREGKNQHGFCLAVGRDYPYDVRVLANVRPDSYWMDTMLHEFGHAAYDKYINPNLPYFLRTIATTAATAITYQWSGTRYYDVLELHVIKHRKIQSRRSNMSDYGRQRGEL